MGKREKTPSPPPPGATPGAPLNSPFRGLAERLGVTLPEGTGPTSAPEPPTAAAPREPHPAPARAVVRLERKGRGGKEVTVVEKLGLPPDELARWCRELKQALGCGGAVESEAIVLQGDLRERVKGELVGRGVRRVAG